MSAQMTDRELMELAAKAAGYEVKTVQCEGMTSAIATIDGWKRIWNPLTDDGDALRLAVKLLLMIDVCEGCSGAQALNVAFCSEPHNNDPCAATRRAITRAAAEIGRGML